MDYDHSTFDDLDAPMERSFLVEIEKIKRKYEPICPENGKVQSTIRDMSEEQKTLHFFQKYKLSFIETPAQLSVMYSLSVENVQKICDDVNLLIEHHVIFGAVRPRSQSWLEKHPHRLNFLVRGQTWGANHVQKKTIHMLLNFAKINGEHAVVKFLKWKTAAYFSHFRFEELPPKPDFKYPKEMNCLWDANVLLGGVYLEFTHRLRNSNPRKFLDFVNSSNYLKKGCSPVPISMISKAEVDTRIDLTEPVQMGCLTEYEMFFRNKVNAALRRSVTELYEGRCFRVSDIFEPFYPSTSACYIWSRGKGGAVSELYDCLTFGKRETGIELGVETCSLSGRVPIRYGKAGMHEELLYRQEVQLLGYEPTEDYKTLRFDATKLKQGWREDYLEVFRLARDERPLVAAVGLPEPLKVRVISKGPPLLYTALKPIQKWLWGVLKENKVFDLISRPVTEEDVNSLLGELKNDEIALSGDYVSSTNKLHSWVSETILDQLMIEIGESINHEALGAIYPPNFLSDLKHLMLKALTKHIFVEDGKEYPQTEGQLMGSVVSFPILCIANAALCRLALEEASFPPQKFRLCDRPYPGSGPIAPVKVNGDDCLLKGHGQRLRPSWEFYCAIAGLQSSVGKTYFSHRFCTINSTIFGWDVSKKSWVEEGYVNMGLLMGRKRINGAGKSKDFVGQVGLHQLGESCRYLKKSCPPDLWLHVKSRFIYYNMKELQRYPGIPWFLPEWLGGVGLPIDNPDELSMLDRKCATLIKNRMNSDPKLKPCKPKDAAMWNMHKLVQKRLKQYRLEEPHMRSGCYENNTFNLEDEYSNLYKLLTVDLLNTEPLENLIEAADEDSALRHAMYHNMAVYSKARHMIQHNYVVVDPIEDDELPLENKDLVIPCFRSDFDSEFSCLIEPTLCRETDGYKYI